MLRTARWSALVVATAAFMTTACRRDDSQVDVAATDSALARDITLASAVTTATPQLRDSPDSAPPTVEAPLPKPKVERKPAPPRTQPRAPEREAPKPEPPAPTPVVEDTAAAVAAAGPRGVIPAGTSVGLTLDSRACSDANRPGDKLVAHTTEAVTATNGAVFPAGSAVVIEVATVAHGSSPDSSAITFRVKTITANDKTRPVAADIVATGPVEKNRVDTKSADKKKVVAGAILGAIVGRVAGGHGATGTVVGAMPGLSGRSTVGRFSSCQTRGVTLGTKPGTGAGASGCAGMPLGDGTGD